MKTIAPFRPEILRWIRNYSFVTFTEDLIAGIIVGVVALPLAIAFGIASGVSPERGLITAIIAGFLISLLGGSRVQIGGPTGAFIVIVYGIVQQYGIQGLMIATILAGVMLIGMGLLKLGSVIRFMPYPIVVGFTSGIALVIFSSQMRDFFGIQTTESVPAEFLEKWHFYFQHLDGINFWSAGIGLFTVAVLAFWPRINRRIPGSLIAIVITTFAVSYFQLPVETIGSRFGEIKATIPLPELPFFDLDSIRTLLAPAFTIAMLGAIESLLSCMVADGIIGSRHDSNTELIGQGIANIVVPLFGGIPATGAIARTMTSIRNGGKTPVAGLVHALVLLLILLFFGKWAALIPMSALAGILLVVAYNMSEWRSFKGLLKNSRSDIAVLLTTFFLTTIIDLTVAIQFGMVLAILLFLKRVVDTAGVSVSHLRVEGESGDDATSMPTIPVPEGVDVFEISGPFFFGLVNRFEEAEKEIRSRSRVRVIRLYRVPFIDATGLNNLRNVISRSKKSGIVTILSGSQHPVLDSLQKSGIIDLVGVENVCGNIELSLERARSVAEQMKED